MIRKEPAGSPTIWSSRIVVSAKADGLLWCPAERPTTHPVSSFLISRVLMGMFKTVLDCWKGFHSNSLTLDSSEATTFMELRRHKYLRAPRGFLDSGDALTKRMNDITAGL